MARETQTETQTVSSRLGKPRPRKPRSAHLTVRLETGDKSLIKACATESGLTVSEWVRQRAVLAAEEQWEAVAQKALAEAFAEDEDAGECGSDVQRLIKGQAPQAIEWDRKLS